MFEEQPAEIRKQRKKALKMIDECYGPRGYVQSDLAEQFDTSQQKISKITQSLSYKKTRKLNEKNLRPNELIPPVYFLDNPIYSVFDNVNLEECVDSMGNMFFDEEEL